MPATARVVVVGAGIAGLAAAHRLTSRGAGVDVVVLEGAPRIGGKLLVGEVAGVAVDTGAEVLLNRRPEAVALAQAAGLGGDVCHPAATSAAIWSRGGVRPMPPTVMGIPADLAALRRSGIVTPLAVDRAGSDADVQDGRAPQDDVSVADFVSRRLGVEILDRLVEPILGGVYAGHASRLSLFAAAPQIAALAARGGSLVAAARATLATSA
ncbi:MAG: protoporphyrinogen oxidase, partial [Actinomycetota bacterium]|nr:protoporphyrinogen oxidase [Actinomycetota bacterium]